MNHHACFNLWVSPQAKERIVPRLNHPQIATLIIGETRAIGDTFAHLFDRGWIRAQEESSGRVNLAFHSPLSIRAKDWVLNAVDEVLTGGNDVFVVTQCDEVFFEPGNRAWKSRLRRLFA